MANGPDYILYRPAAPAVSGNRPAGQPVADKVYPLTPGVWQQEAVETLKLYADKDAGFTPVTQEKQLSLFGGPEQAQEVQAPRTDPEQLIPHWQNFKFLSEDTRRFVHKLRDLHARAGRGRSGSTEGEAQADLSGWRSAPLQPAHQRVQGRPVPGSADLQGRRPLSAQ